MDSSRGEFIRKLAREEMVGFEIVQQSKHQITLKEITVIAPEEFDNLIRRAFFIIKDVMSELHGTITSQDFSSLPLLIERDADINKLTDHCRRILYLRGFSAIEKTPHIYVITEGFEKIGDMIRDFAKFLLEKDLHKISSDLEKLFVNVLGYFNLFYELFYDFKLEAMNIVEERRKLFKKQVREFLRNKRNSAEAEGLLTLNAAYELIYDLTGPLIAFKS